MEHLRIAMTDDQADELATGRFHRTDHVAPQVPAVISLGRAGASFDPLVARARIAFEACLIAKKHAGGRICQQGGELLGAIRAP